MFAYYDYSLYNSRSIVKVTFDKRIHNDIEFSYFLYNWLKLYEKQKYYTFIFDTSKMGFIPLKYCFEMANFIKKLKKRPIQYLTQSIIIVKNNFIKCLLDLIFNIQLPVAVVYIIKDK